VLPGEVTAFANSMLDFPVTSKRARDQENARQYGATLNVWRVTGFRAENWTMNRPQNIDD
jgi:hypothetical protein